MQWQFLAEKWFWTRAVAFEGTVYVGCFDGKLYAFNASSGTKVAEFDLESPIRSWPVLAEDRVIVATEAGKLYSVDTATNGLALFADLDETVYAPLAFSDGVIYVYSQEKNLHALNVATGVGVWIQTID